MSKISLFFWRFIPSFSSLPTEEISIGRLVSYSKKYMPCGVSSLSEECDASFIIPVYNASKYIAKCLDSILKQDTQFSYEIICVDDGSTDDSWSILERYSVYPKVKIFRKSNGGISSARNFGLKHATGKYVGFLDNDDYVECDFVEKLLIPAKEKDADVVKCRYRVVGESGDVIFVGGIDVNETFCGGSLKVSTMSGFPWDGIYKRTFFDVLNFPEGFWYEDMIMKSMLLASASKIVLISAPLYNFVKRKKSTSHFAYKKETIKTLDQFFLAESIVCDLLQKKINISSVHYNIFLNEYGKYLSFRTKNLNRALRKALFVLSCKRLNQIRPANVMYSKDINELMDMVFRQMNFTKWDFFKYLAYLD